MARKVPINREPTYKDIDLNFQAHPATGDIIILEDEDAIKRSVRNLIFTNFREKPFRSGVGSALRQMLFENPDPIMAIAMKEVISSLINNYEPRVKLLNINISVDFDRNGFNVELYYTIRNTEQPIISVIFLERLR